MSYKTIEVWEKLINQEAPRAIAGMLQRLDALLPAGYKAGPSIVAVSYVIERENKELCGIQSTAFRGMMNTKAFKDIWAQMSTNAIDKFGEYLKGIKKVIGECLDAP